MESTYIYRRVQLLVMRKFHILIIFISLFIHTECKNPNNNSGSIGSIDNNDINELSTPVYETNIQDDFGEVSYHNASGDSLLLVNERMSTENITNSRIKISEYLGKMRFDSKASLLTLPSGYEVLFLHYFSGGAHCCSVLEAYIYNERLKAYELLDSYGYDGDMVELTHPFDVSNFIEYFYCSYAAGQDFNCASSDYSEKLYFEDNKFIFKATGTKEILVDCYLNYLRTNHIPELNDGQDLGEREKIANFFLKYYSLDPNLERVFSLYNSYFPRTRDKAILWSDLIDRLIPKNERTKAISNQILAFNSRLAERVIYRPANQLYYNHPQERELDGLSCDELAELVQNEGNRSDYLTSGELDSEMLYSIELYEYLDTYYIVAVFQTGGTYIYCDVSRSAWSNFKDNDYNSFGRSFQTYIAKEFICNCQ